jgi:hypothetical protein
VEEGPPDDAEQWSDEQWLAWLSETDEAAQWEQDVQRMRSATDRLPVGGRLLYAGMRGLYEVIYGRIDEPAIVIEASGDGPGDEESLEVHLDPDHPEDSTVVVRPWLIDP